MTLRSMPLFFLVVAIGLTAQYERDVEDCLANHSVWGRDVCEKLARGDIWIGMTQEMILAGRGDPRSVDRPLGEDSTREDWTYCTARFGLVVLQFEDGILKTWGPANPDCPACQVRPPDD